MAYLFVDCETSGKAKNFKAPVTDFNNWPTVVSIGWILTEYDGTPIVESYHVVQPKPGVKFDAEAIEIHGITEAEATRIGVPVEHVLQAFLQDAERCTHIICHNYQFDSNVIRCELHRLGMKDIFANKESICTMFSSTKFCNLPGEYGAKWPKLVELHTKLFGKEFEGAHNAMDDISATAKCFFELQRLNVIPTHQKTEDTMPVKRNNKGMIIGFHPDGPQYLTNEEFDQEYPGVKNMVPPAAPKVPEVPGLPTPPPPTSEIVTEAPKRKRRTKAQIAEDMKLANTPVPSSPPPSFPVTDVTIGTMPAGPSVISAPGPNTSTIPPTPPVPHSIAVPIGRAPAPPAPVLSPIEVPASLRNLVKSHDINQERGLIIAGSMAEFFRKAADWKKRIGDLKIESADDHGAMKVAREARLIVKELRLDAKKLTDANRDKIKDQIAPYLAESELWLRCYQTLEAELKPIEADLKEKEDYAKKLEELKIQELQLQRSTELSKHIWPIDPLPIPSNLGTITEDEFQKIVKTYMNEYRTQKDAADKLEAERQAKEKLFQTRLGQLTGTTFDGKSITFAGRTVATADSLVAMSDVAFNTVRDAHLKNMESEAKIAEESKKASRVNRLLSLGLTIEGENLIFRGQPVYAVTNVPLLTDEQFEGWYNSYVKFLADENAAQQAEMDKVKKQNEALVFEARKKSLLEIGLGFDGAVFSFNGKQFVSMFSVSTMNDQEFAIAYTAYKSAIDEEKQLQAAEQEVAQKNEALNQPELLKIEGMIRNLEEFPYPIVSSAQGKHIVDMTKDMHRQIIEWANKEKLKL